MLFHYMLIAFICSLFIFQSPWLSSFRGTYPFVVYGLLVDLRYEKLHSFFQQNDSLFFCDNQTLIFNNTREILLPTGYTVSSNRTFLGFTSHLTTKLAGSIVILSSYQRYKITLPVGVGILKCYRL